MKYKFKIGDTVIVKTYNITGVILEQLNDGYYRVERKNQSFIVLEDHLMLVKKNTRYEKMKVGEMYDPLDNVYEMDFHGLTKLEAVNEVTYVILNASVHQFPIIRITHGKGKGILRMAIHDLLKEYKEEGIIKGYEYAQNHQGGYGVTIVFIR